MKRPTKEEQVKRDQILDMMDARAGISEFLNGLRQSLVDGGWTPGGAEAAIIASMQSKSEESE